MSGRAYTYAERAEAVALALSLGDVKRAARESGVPRRTLTRWMAELRDGEGRVATIVAEPVTLTTIRDRFASIVAQGVAVLGEKINDPRTRAGEVAQAVDVSIRGWALVDAAARAEAERKVLEPDDEPWPMTPDELATTTAFWRAIAEASDDEIREYLGTHGIDAVRLIAPPEIEGETRDVG